jgi:ribonucleotide monophosphatase NagD (HAD superfamily)
VVGKPAEFMLANIADAFGLKREQICMVGDRLDTDILFGQHGGLTTMLVLSGALLLGAHVGACLQAACCTDCMQHVLLQARLH